MTKKRLMRRQLITVATVVEQTAVVGFVGSLPISIAFTQVALGLGWASFLFRCILDRRWHGKRTPIDAGVAAFLVACILATVFSPQPLVSLVGLKKFYLVSGAYLLAYTVKSWKRVVELAQLFAYMSALAAVYGMVFYFYGGQWKLLGTQTMALTASGIFMISSLLSAGIAAVAERRVTKAGLVAAAIASNAALLLTKSLSSWLGWLAGGAALMWLTVRSRLALAGVILAVAFIALFGLAGRGLLRDYDVREYKTWSWQVRHTIWMTGWEMIKERPVLGYGLVDMNRYYLPKRLALKNPPVPDSRSFGHLHNNFLQILAIGGVVGLAAFCYMLWTVFSLLYGIWRCGPPPKKALAAAVFASHLAFIVNGLAEWNYGDSEVVTIFWVLTGLMLACNYIIDGKSVNQSLGITTEGKA